MTHNSQRQHAYYLYRKGLNPGYKPREKYATGSGRDWRKIMVGRARRFASKHLLPFNLTYKDIVIPEVCPILGVQLRTGWGKGRNNKDTCASLDRIIPELGYVKGNVIVVSYRANRIKNDATWQELLTLGNFYKNLLAVTPQNPDNNVQ